MSACANCGEGLHGEFCAHCGQRDRDLQRPFRALAGEALDDLLHLDARALRTIAPLLLKPGEVTRAYRAGHRVAFVPPLRAYLVAALVFFSLFTVFEDAAPVEVFTRGTPEAAAAKNRGGAGGGRVTFEVPARSAVFDEAYQRAVARAKANPQAFGGAVFGNVPRTFFVLLPIFALLLELFYRTRGYYIEHLVFSLHYHTFAFAMFAVMFAVNRVDNALPRFAQVAIGTVLFGWLLAYLPIALRRVYGGSWPETLLKWMGLGLLYLPVMVFSMVIMMFISLARF